jgi:hypothetical protein
MQKKEPIKLTIHEELLILALRHRFRNKEVIVLMRDGQPVRILKAWDGVELDN